MEQQKCLGIYLSAGSAVGVLLEGNSGHYKVAGACSIERDVEQPDESLGAMIAEKINAQKLKYNEVSIAIDCSLYTQHDLHSEFSDYKQIANTIRFDAEEAVATDAMDLAITFDITHTGDNGSDVTVYTAKRDLMDDMLNGMMQKGIDPTAMEPDIVCLTRFIEKNNTPFTNRNRLIVNISPTACYLILPSDSHQAPCVRSFLVSPSQDITSVLSREIPITIASMPTSEPITSITVSGRVENVNNEEFTQRTGLEVATVDLAKNAGADTSHCPEGVIQSDFEIAYGAALAELSKTRKTDFRKDFNPYEGRKRIIQAALRIFSIAATLIVLAVGVHFQNSVNKTNKLADQLKKSLYEEQAAVIFGKPYSGAEKLSSKLSRELRNVKQGKSGPSFGDDSSVTARLTFLFEAVNKTKANNRIIISKISVTAKTMRVEGTTASRGYTNDFFSKIDAHKKLRKGLNSVSSKRGSEDTFSVNIELK